MSILAPAGKVEALLGNEALVRGALEAGLSVAASYPGTPSTEIGDTLAFVAKEAGVYFEWSVNEKVATEVVAAASWSGLRAMTSMKHVGLNVASDALFTLAYAGAKGGLVVVTAGDPSAHSSQSEQDNRYYATVANLPMLEPATAQEAKDFTKMAFELSERYSLPFLVGLTTRVSHCRGPVRLEELKKGVKKGEFKPDSWDQYIQVGPMAVKHHKELLDKMRRIEDEQGGNPKLNFIEGPDEADLGIVASGISYTYAYEAVKALGVTAKMLKLGLVNPFPKELVGGFLKDIQKVIMIEELEPFLEVQVKAAANNHSSAVEVFGKLTGHFPRIAEYNPRVVMGGLAEITGKELPVDIKGQEGRARSVVQAVPPRPPVLCPACPHRATGYIVRRATAGSAIYVGDVGCYTLLLQKPFQVQDISHAMGSSIGFAGGFSVSTDQPVVAMIGDSTFFHAGIPALLNAVHNKHKLTVVIMDNRTTAMTGHQSHPGVPIDAMGDEAPEIGIKGLVEAIGVEFVEGVDPYRFDRLEETMRRALSFDGVSVVIARRECALLTVRRRRNRGEAIIPYRVDPERCTHCLTCINTYACPAFVDEGDKVSIDPSICFGCGSCATICPFEAIEPTEGARPWLEEES